MQSNFAVNKHLQTVASRWILLIQCQDARNHEYKIKCRIYILLKHTKFIGNFSRPNEYRKNSKKHITELRAVRYVYCDQFFSHTSVLSISGSRKMIYAESQITFLKNISTTVQVLQCGKFQDVSTDPAVTCFLILNNVSAGFHAEKTSPALFQLGHSSPDSCINPG